MNPFLFPVRAVMSLLIPRASNRRIRLLVAWLICLGIAGQRIHEAITNFSDEPGTPQEQVRNDGNRGHALIDFGGQWVMGRMVVTGHGRELFHRNRHWEIVRGSFPRSAEAPETQRLAFPESVRPPGMKITVFRHDAEELMGAMIGDDSPKWKDFSVAVALPFAGSGPLDTAVFLNESQRQTTPELVAELERPCIGGPLYPPVHSLLYSPLGLLEPQPAYRLFQLLTLFMTLFCGWLVRVRSDGEIWTPVATAGLLLFSGFRVGFDLGQNHVFTLAILLGGWVLAKRDREFLGGAVWGLLAFKPVWGLAFVLIPLLTGRWRFLLGLAVSGCSLVALTLPILGIQAWFDWLAVGSHAASLYNVNERWIDLSRDLSGIVRRVVLDFGKPEAERQSPLADRLSWMLWGGVLVSTIVVHRLRRFRPESLAFLLLGAVLTGYRFMLYDLVLAYFALAVFVAQRRPGTLQEFLKSFTGVMVILLLLCENWWTGLDLRFSVGFGYFAHPVGTGNDPAAIHVPTLHYTTNSNFATDTILLLILWFGWGVSLLRQPRSSSSASPISGERINDSPTSTA